MSHWQLLVVCPVTNVVAWFCSLRKKPDTHIKTAINNVIFFVNNFYRRIDVDHVIIISSAMKTANTTANGTNNQGTPKWIEVKSHVQSGGYECGYYVMHWMWNIISGGLKNDWTMWFLDGTTLDKETITTIHQKWASYFLKVQSNQCTKS
ncbi:hypothetical protein HKD37_06G017123 [Glycine soja]